MSLTGVLAEFYFTDARLTLIPIEHLTPDGMRGEFAALIMARRGWDTRRVEFFNAAFRRYWTRTQRLASQTGTWAPPRVRHVALVQDALAVPPYVQLLNTSSWMLYDSDFDPVASHVEFAAYLLVHGDRMALTREVTMAAIANAAYWFERTDAECADFGAAAARSNRPDAEAFRSLAAALPWLRELRHETLRPAPAGTCRVIPGTGLLVPRRLEAAPTALLNEWTTAAQTAVAAFDARWHAHEPAPVGALCDWLAVSAPPLLITTRRDRVAWDAQHPTAVGALRAELREASGVAVRDLLADLQTIEHHTRMFQRCLRDPTALPPPARDTEQRGYCYLHRERGVIAYNLHEPGIERLRGPALPYARAMLGARTIHEWAHLAVAAGWVPQTAPRERVAHLTHALADEFDETIAAAPQAVRARTSRDLAALRHQGAGTPMTAGAALVRIILGRLPDYQANLLAQRFLDQRERETYVRHNVRTLRSEYAPDQLWRMLARYLIEYQYLGFSDVTDRRTYFHTSTWFDADFLATRILSLARFDALAGRVAAWCATHSVDESRFRSVERSADPESINSRAAHIA